MNEYMLQLAEEQAMEPLFDVYVEYLNYINETYSRFVYANDVREGELESVAGKAELVVINNTGVSEYQVIACPRGMSLERAAEYNKVFVVCGTGFTE